MFTAHARNRVLCMKNPKFICLRANHFLRGKILKCFVLSLSFTPSVLCVLWYECIVGCKQGVTYWRPVGGAEDDIYVFRCGSAGRVEALPTASLKPEIVKPGCDWLGLDRIRWDLDPNYDPNIWKNRVRITAFSKGSLPWISASIIKKLISKQNYLMLLASNYRFKSANL